MERTIIKRNGDIVKHDESKITLAIEKALLASGEVNWADTEREVAERLKDKVQEEILQIQGILTVEKVQDLVELVLMKSNYYKTAKAYILYREKRSEKRNEKIHKNEIVSNSELEKLSEETDKYFDGNTMREFVYYRTYSRWIPDKGRREYWPESIDRYIAFMKENISKREMALGRKILEEKDYLEMREAILKQEVMPSMRLLQFSGAPARRCNTCVYNCSFSAPETFKDLADIMYLLMNGCGVGYSVEHFTVDKFPVIVPQIKPPGVSIKYVIEDSKEGWCDAFQFGLETWFVGKDVDFDYSLLRPAGARLKTMGGRSSGPQPLIDLMKFTKDIIMKKAGGKLSSIDLYDIVCMIAQIVVSGGVRRCIAKGTRVITQKESFKNIEDIQVDDLVMTNDGWKKVMKTFNQGEQEIIRIVHQEGYLDCTPNHKVAVIKDMKGEIEWVKAEDLKSGDVLGFPIKDNNNQNIFKQEGINKLPEFKYIKPYNSTTCKDIVIPELDEWMAWLIGNIQGDGHIMLTSGSGRVSVAVFGGDIEQKNMTETQLKRFGVNIHTQMPRKKDNCFKVNAQSKQLATYLHKHVKQSKTTLRIPEFIKVASARIKACFLQGLMDADGSVKTRPIQLVTSIYEEYIKDIQALLLSMGIISRYRFCSVKIENWQNKFSIGFINQRDKSLFSELTKDIGFKKFNSTSEVKKSNSWPMNYLLNYLGENRPNNWSKVFATTNKNIPYDTLRDKLNIIPNYIPIKIKELIKLDEKKETYDIEVEKDHVFVAGGVLVHNSSTINLSDLKDGEMRDAKKGAFWVNNPQRAMANNSAVYYEKPTQIEFMKEWLSLAESSTGERGIFNRGSLKRTIPKRRVDFLGDKINEIGVNPCGEALVRTGQFCNLSEVVCRAKDTEEDLHRKIRIATIMGTYQSSLTDFKYVSKKWKENQESERLLGVSLTGQYDCPIVRNSTVLNKLRDYSVEINKTYAEKFGINQSTSITLIKPSGTISQLVDSASGIHPRFSPYYIRRIRISTTDPLLQLMKDQGYPVVPEVGQLEGSATTYVLEFPVAAPKGAICVKDVKAIDQLEYWKIVKLDYCEHNPSVTIYVKPDEWLLVGKWVWDNWDIVGGLSFLPFSEHIYQLAPYEEITEEKYLELAKKSKKVDFSKLVYYEKSDETDVKKEVACAGGVCEL